ncbi:MAG: hypothetical protein U9N76_00360 [Candidatus Marinimicrobia bacterium]|nr:hypothetical protein [Candidatus Neomarinimicrobiota bacterium]
MKIYTKIILIILIGISGLLAVDTGGYGGAYLRMPTDARMAGLGNSAGAILNDLAGVYENPANVSLLKSKQFSSSFQFLSLDRKHSMIGFGTNMPPTAGFSIMWVHAGVDEIEGRNYSNNFTEMYSTSQNAILTSFGVQLSEKISVGATAKILWDRLPGAKGSGFGMDIGVTAIPIENLIIGFIAKDLGGGIKWDTGDNYVYQIQKQDDFPALYNVNVAYTIIDRILITGAFKGSETISPTYHFGTEIEVIPHFVIRGGVDDKMPIIGFGTEYNAWKNIFTSIDYAFLLGKYGEGVSHIFTWKFRF